jgi:PEGA domain
LPRCAMGLLLGLLAFSCPVLGQEKESPAAEQRAVLQHILEQTYQPSEVGKGLFGVGSGNAIRRAGVIVVVQRPGLYASLDRNEIASSTLHGLDANLIRGNKDYAVPAGERFYVFSVSVGETSVTFGLLTGRLITVQHGTARLWTAVSFNFSPETLSNADKDAVFRAIDPWFVPEGHATYGATSGAPTPPATMAVAAPAVAPAGSVQQAPSPPPARAPADLSPGMTRDQVVAALGAPQREVKFGDRIWLTYPGMVLLLEGGKLASVDQSGQPPAKVGVHSDPAGGDIYFDGKMVGLTPSTFELPPGDHQISVQLSGYQDWVRQVHVLSGSEINLDAKLEKK